MCEHEETTRYDLLCEWISSFLYEKRTSVCTHCHNQLEQFNRYAENEKLVKNRGYKLIKQSQNERGDILFDIECENGHITENRTKTSFMRSFSCKECKEEEKKKEE